MHKRMLIIRLLLAVCLFVATQLQSGTAIAQQPAGYQLVWFDEFEVDGLPDSTKWSYDLGDGCPELCGWGNNELQFYQANNKKNARVENGHLIIEAHQEKVNQYNYTSSRMVTKNKGDWRYGRIEVKARLPKGLGVWPAIWMLPSKKEYGGWPHSGEIDIMENVGYMPDSILGSVHAKSLDQTNGINCKDNSTKDHIYAIEWTEQKIDFYFDQEIFQTVHNPNKGHFYWPFDKQFHLLLNFAVGGNWGGKMGVSKDIWPQRFIVDYVRVYQKKSDH